MHGAERHGRSGQCAGAGEAGSGQGSGDHSSIVGDSGGVFVGPAFDGEAHGGGGCPQQRVGGGGEAGELGVGVVAVAQVGVFVGEQHPAFVGGQRAQHRRGDHDPAGEPGQGVGVGMVVVDDDEAGGGGAQPPAGEFGGGEVLADEDGAAGGAGGQPGDGERRQQPGRGGQRVVAADNSG